MKELSLEAIGVGMVIAAWIFLGIIGMIISGFIAMGLYIYLIRH